ncbi:hypothetical protein HDF19_12775 [Mucilaginibacter sp. E4BP6]|uniref:hypothetical protein n=1 Tax=Mucilaginibacter sp. E4BP6 TaxID=2723089 RepID=UPI0015CC0BD7|nr:hypothetical protein [Mucilaginibacter sp. E4BP6]NYE64956.1 hypothetical protein [Mucilaginibacter sp. E4BP6]
MGLISYLLKLFKFKPGWNGTPEIFLAMVVEMQSQNNPEYAVHEVLQWGEVMQKVIKVNFKPFKDFPDLLQNGVPDFSMVEKLRGKLAEVKQRTTLKKAIYGEHADLGDDDVMKSNSAGAVFARNMVKDLSDYIQFPEDDQHVIDKLKRDE